MSSPVQSRAAAVRELAARRDGVLAHDELIALGVPAPTVRSWVRRGHLVRLYREVYALERPPATERGRAIAALLAAGDGAVLSHGTAAVLLEDPAT